MQQFTFTCPESTPVQIPLSRGLFALIDADDSEMVKQYSWCACPGGKTYYASHSVRHKAAILMHRYIVGARDGDQVDHRNGNGLDNRRQNLRICSRAENAQNKSKRSDSASRFKGVWHYARYGTWRAMIRVAGRLLILGRFATEEEAAHAYDWAAKEHFGEFARLNFPDDEPCQMQPLTRKNTWRKRISHNNQFTKRD